MVNKIPLNFKKGISTFQIIILIIVGYYVWGYVQDNYIYKDLISIKFNTYENILKYVSCIIIKIEL